MSLLESLQGRGRRRVTVRLPRPEAPLGDVQTFNQLAAVVDAVGADALNAGERALWDRIRARLGELFELVELEAMLPVEFEALWSAHQRVGADGRAEADWPRLHAPLFAACSVDPELRDPAVWQGLLHGGQVSHGDVLTLQRAVLELNAGLGGIGVPLAG